MWLCPGYVVVPYPVYVPPGDQIVPVPELLAAHPVNVYPLRVGIVDGIVNVTYPVPSALLPYSVLGAPVPPFALKDSVA